MTASTTFGSCASARSCGVARHAGPQQRRADPRREELRVQQHGVVLDPLDVGGVELAVPQRRLQRLGDPAGPQPVVAGVEVVDPAVRPELVERVVVQRGAGRVVVRADEEPVARVDRVRHLGRRQDLVRQRLAGVVVHGRQPLVAAGPVPHQVRRDAVDVAGLQVLAQRQLAAGEVRDVAAAVGVRPVLRADVERLQALLEVGQVLRLHPGEERVQLLGRRVAGVLDRQRGAGRLVELHDRALVAARHDQRRGRDPVARRDHRRPGRRCWPGTSPGSPAPAPAVPCRRWRARWARPGPAGPAPGRCR